MKNLWIRFGCFLTGYNYNIVRNSSEVVAKAVKRYTAALVIICILWSFIGFAFTKRYILHNQGTWEGFFGAIIGIVIIVQIERQIILSITPSKFLYVARGTIALMMAIIGAVIVDQIIFKDDIELEKTTFVEARVKQALIYKTAELREQLLELDSTISHKEQERIKTIEDISLHPTTLVFSTQPVLKTERNISKDTLTNKSSVTEKSTPIMVTTSSHVANPKIALLPSIDSTLKNLRAEKKQKEEALLNVRPQIEKEINSKIGFLDELKVMLSLISGSTAALLFWLLWFFFFLGLEMLVLISKINDKEDDYGRTVKHHMDLQIRKLDMFAKMGTH
ncbi:MAG: DUF4407 domain-containing protein [Filimonas sp.]|nr:DUF4407 domain-containing protein [Filimonas sp.]